MYVKLADSSARPAAVRRRTQSASEALSAQPNASMRMQRGRRLQRGCSRGAAPARCDGMTSRSAATYSSSSSLSSLGRAWSSSSSSASCFRLRVDIADGQRGDAMVDGEGERERGKEGEDAGVRTGLGVGGELGRRWGPVERHICDPATEQGELAS